MFSPEGQQKDIFETIQRMAYLAEYREKGIRNHIERIRGFCHIIALGLGLTQHESHIISTACQLHDIGKVGIPEAIFLKADELTPYEWEFVQRHTTIGGNILEGSSSPYLQVGEKIALSHHERWDGSGYPNGLVRDSIPLSGRICAVADVFDALTTKRSYKEEIRPDKACDLIVNASGQLFDPDIVKIFNDQFHEIMTVRQMNV